MLFYRGSAKGFAVCADSLFVRIQQFYERLGKFGRHHTSTDNLVENMVAVNVIGTDAQKYADASQRKAADTQFSINWLYF